MADVNARALHGLNVRAWYVEDGVHPKRPPVPLIIGKMGDPTQNKGEKTRITVPDPNNFEGDTQVGTTPGSAERATFSMMARFITNLSDFIRIMRKDCRLDVYALAGKCKNPGDFSNGWEKIIMFPDGDVSSHSFENFGAFGTEEAEPTNETLELTSREYYEIGAMSFQKVASAQAVREIHTVDVCDDAACGDCGRQSDGCQRVLVTMAGTGATPGTTPTLIYTDNGFETVSTEDISTLFSTETPSDGACIGGLYVIVSNASHSLHFRNLEDLYNGIGSWSEADAGFVAAGAPNAIWSVDPRHTWIVGDGGYVYFTASPAGGAVVQDAGVATSQNLNDVHAYDNQEVLAVGELNAVVYTVNGGKTWQSVLGPEVGIAQNCCWVWAPGTWFVGSSQGSLWLTENYGITWQEVGTDFESVIPVALTEIDAIEFTDEAEGFLIGRVGANGVMLRTITAGNDWVELPNGENAAIPANDYLNDLATCGTGQNRAYAGGLDDNNTNGIVIEAAA